jgi:hypothetical protein
MALLNQSTLVSSQLSGFFDTLLSGQAPDKFNREFLRDIGFTSSNHLALIPLLKGLGFLSADNSPTERYRSFLDKTKSRKIIAEALKEAYGDIFVIKTKPTKADLELIQGKYKSTYNLSDLSADRAAKTFLALLELADPETLYGQPEEQTKIKDHKAPDLEPDADHSGKHPTKGRKSVVGLNYNIEIHLPATKDVEIYNAIFKSLREHLID